MDFKERMEQMRRDMERRRQEMNQRMEGYRSQFGGGLYSHNDSRDVVTGTDNIQDDHSVSAPHSTEDDPCSNMQSSSPLLHHPGLEDESETKLGMFERMYPDYCRETKSFSFESFGYSDIDFSPLISLLAGIGEIELYESLHGISEGISSIPLDKRKATYGDFIRLIKDERCRKYLARHLEDIDTDVVVKQLQSIRMMRNSANHKGVITKDLFNKFFNKYYTPFFNETLPELIRLKRKDSPKYSGEVSFYDGQNIGPSKMGVCKTDEEYGAFLDSLFSIHSRKESAKPARTRLCVIWTNTKKLAVKYLTQEHAGCQNFIRSYFAELKVPGITYVLFDAAEPEFEKYIQTDDNWQNHHVMLQKFRDSILGTFGIDYPVSLYIIGGDDVIPMPKVGNPVSYSLHALGGMVLEDVIEVDWLYSFPKKCVNLDVDGCVSVNELSFATPNFYVSRLPLESGLMESDLESDICGYFAKAIPYLESEIVVEKVGAVAMETCRVIMDNTIKGFPRCDLKQFAGDYRFNDFFTSPKIVLDNSENEGIVQEYAATISDCDMLTFDLHGGPQPGNPDYCGESAGEKKLFPKAFSKDILSGSNVKIIVPISCWGARFIGYRRDNSMLLYSMYNTDTLLFMGSCRIAYGSKDECGPELRYGSWLMRLFMQNLLTGIPAGEALYRAKVDYLTNHSEGKVHDFLTVQQFNLFGDPMLKVKPCLSINRIDSQPISGIALPDFSWCDYKYNERCIYEKTSGTVSVLDRVRNLVDVNLDDIRQRMNDVLYKHYNIAPENLRRITRYVTGKGDIGMRFVYSQDGAYPASVMAYSDEHGNLKDIVYTF